MKQPNNILVLTYWDFNDALIQTYTLPYLKIIASHLPQRSQIYLFTLSKKPVEATDLSAWNIEVLNHPYKHFGMGAAFDWLKIIARLKRLIFKQNINVIHTWCTPAGGMGYLLSKLTGKKLILDSFEPHAIAMVENGAWKKNSWAFKILFLLEKKQIKRANQIIGTTSELKLYAEKLYQFAIPNYHVKPACVDLSLFSIKNDKTSVLSKKLGLENKIVCVYAGKFGGIYYEKEVFAFFKACETYFGDKFCALILSSHAQKEIFTLAQDVQLNESSFQHHFVPFSEVSSYMALGNFAICPVKPVPTKRFCTPIKNGEYWALGLPVVIPPNISEDSQIIEENSIGAIWKNTNEDGCLEAIRQIDQLLHDYSREELYAKIRPIAEKYRNFEIAEKIYAEIYGR